MRARGVTFIALTLALASCAMCATGCPHSTPPTTSLRVSAAQSAPKAARVTIDDEPVGSLDLVVKRGVALPPGKHHITIEADGFFPWDAEVDAGESGGVVTLDVKMVPIPQ